MFVGIAQIFGFKSTFHSDEELLADTNPWNDRKADDFLRYIKHDFFVAVYILAQFFSALYWSFSKKSFIDSLGKRDVDKAGACMITILIIRFFMLILYYTKMAIGIKAA